MHQFTKQTRETFYIYGGITNVIATGDAINVDGSSVIVLDNSGEDATSTIVTSLSLYETTKVKTKVEAAGTEVLSPYKITFLIATEAGEVYEVDVFMTIDNV